MPEKRYLVTPGRRRCPRRCWPPPALPTIHHRSAGFRAGFERVRGLLGFFVGQVMKETQGKADVRVVNERLREKLSV